MKINYKFNKSSEALTCKVESVELEIIEMLLTVEQSKELNLKSEYNWINKYSYFWFNCNYYWHSAEKGVLGWTLLKKNLVNNHYIDVKTNYDFRFNLRAELLFPSYEEVIESFSKNFTNQQDLKDYINSIKEPIEFIGSSSIDDVLLKDWLGEWEYTDCTWSDLMEGKESIKIGSPKLNTNWKFKIK